MRKQKYCVNCKRAIIGPHYVYVTASHIGPQSHLPMP